MGDSSIVYLDFSYALQKERVSGLVDNVSDSEPGDLRRVQQGRGFQGAKYEEGWIGGWRVERAAGQGLGGQDPGVRHQRLSLLPRLPHGDHNERRLVDVLCSL